MPVTAQFNTGALSNALMPQGGGNDIIDRMYKISLMQQAQQRNRLLQQEDNAYQRLSQIYSETGGDWGKITDRLYQDPQLSRFASPMLTEAAAANTGANEAIQAALETGAMRSELFTKSLGSLLQSDRIDAASVTDALTSFQADMEAAGMPVEDMAPLIQKGLQLADMPPEQQRQTIMEYMRRSMSTAEQYKQAQGQLVSAGGNLWHTSAFEPGEVPTATMIGPDPANATGADGITNTQRGRVAMLINGMTSFGVDSEVAAMLAQMEVGGGIYTGIDPQTGRFDVRVLGTGGEVDIPQEAAEFLYNQANVPDIPPEMLAQFRPEYEDYVSRRDNIIEDIMGDRDLTPEEISDLFGKMSEDWRMQAGASEDEWRAVERLVEQEQEGDLLEEEEEEGDAAAPYEYEEAYGQAMGLAGFGRGTINLLSGTFGEPRMREVQAVAEQLETRSVAMRDFFRNLAEGRELSALEQRFTQREVLPARWWTTPSRAEDRVTSHLDLMEELLEENSRLAVNDDVGERRRQDAEATLETLQNDVAYWEMVQWQLEQFNQRANRGVQPIPEGERETEDIMMRDFRR